MSITDKTRKILWAKSGNKCAICPNQQLVMNVSGNETIIGEECHIISSKKDGPRYKILENYDDYKNLILLCPIHHKIIDDNESVFTEMIIHGIKKNHEKKIFDQLNKTNIDGILLYKMEHTRDLIRCLDGAEQFVSDYPVECDYDYSLFSEFFEYVNDSDVLEFENEFAKIKIFDYIVTRIKEAGYVILLGNDESYGEYKLKTSFVYIRTIEDYEKNKISI